MADKSKNSEKKQEVVDSIIIQHLTESKSDWVVQPFNLTMLRGDMDKVSLTYIVNMMDALQERIGEFFNRTDEQKRENPNLFTKEELDAEKLPTIRIPLKAMGVIPQNYAKLEKATNAIVGARYVFDEKINGVAMKSYVPLFSKISIPKLEPTAEGKRAKRASYIEVKINPEMGIHAFDMRYHHRYLKNVVFECNGRYAARLYLLLSASQNSKWDIPYQDLRKLTYVDVYTNKPGSKNEWEKSKYPKYPNFKQRVLDASKKEIDRLAEEGKVDFTFTYEEIFEYGKREGDPWKIIFHIHQTAIGKKAAEDRENARDRIELSAMLSETLNLSPSDIGRVIKLMGFSSAKASDVKKKSRELAAYLGVHPEIEKKRAYVMKSLTAFLEDMIPVAEETASETANNTSSSVSETNDKQVDIIRDNVAGWDEFIRDCEELVGQVNFTTWVKPVTAESFENGVLTISVPSQFFAEYWEEHIIGVIVPAFRKHFGEYAKLEYRINQ